jgi:FKBP-type peptidyl-prolyl cis-trans isomerase FklB
MRKKILISVSLIMLLAVQIQAEELQTFKTPKEKTSYAIGVDLVRNFKSQAIDADLAAVVRGMQEESAGKKLQMTESEINKTLKDYNLEMKAKQALLRQQLADKNKKTGAEFLAANKAKEGVVSTASGLQYKVIKAGNGKKPLDNDGVTLRYRGMLLDGTEFDSSERNIGYPVTFFVKDSVIDGWKEALKLMPAGSKWQIFIPSELGYGEKGVGRDIGPNATLMYEIELLAVNPQPILPKKKD